MDGGRVGERGGKRGGGRGMHEFTRWRRECNKSENYYNDIQFFSWYSMAALRLNISTNPVS